MRIAPANAARTHDRFRVSRYAESEIPTVHGGFRVIVFREAAGGAEHVAIVRGDVAGRERVPVRVHSECFTAEVLGSLKCDCRGQLDLALAYVARAGAGAIVYLRQEGRGIGLGNKIRAYALQANGADTVDANRMLGFEDDLRSYDVAAEILRALAIRSVVLLTNNPRKVEGLRGQGVIVVARKGVEVTPNEHNRGYLETKRDRLGHLLAMPKRPAPRSRGRRASSNRTAARTGR